MLCVRMLAKTSFPCSRCKFIKGILSQPLCIEIQSYEQIKSSSTVKTKRKENLTFEDCLEDWLLINLAEEIKS